MYPRVTAILVARNGAAHLPRTLDALSTQTRRPDSIVTVDCGSTDSTAELLAEFGPTHFIAAGEELSFGDAVATAVRVTAPPTSNNELLWLIAQDSAPEPDALAALVGALEIAPSVAIVGPKQMDWDRADYFREFGESMTRYGASISLVGQELDQAQHDILSDVMAVGAGGMLVRHRVWEQLGGFDPALPVVDDALDLCVRARLAGHRVSVVPAARIASAGDGVAGPSASQRGAARRKRLRQRRSAQLHRRLVYAPAAAVPFHWLSLVPLAILRSILRLLRKQPGAIAGEFTAAFGAAFSGFRTSAARRQLARTRALGWASIAPLRVPGAEVHRRRALLREAQITRARGARSELRFFSGGGAWTVLAAVAVAAVVLAPLFGAPAISGGGLLPLSATPAELWQNTGYGWRDIGVGFVGAADPFASVLAVLGSLAFWEPSFALLLLYFLAIPLAALGAWMAAARLTEHGWLRALAAVLWMLAPTFLSAVVDGRPAAILVHLLLPWLFFAGVAAARSWSSAATAALLFAAIIACAPSLAPALLVMWLVAVALSGRSAIRYLGIPIPMLALAAPLVFDQYSRAQWLALVADPGVAIVGPRVSVWQLVLGFPDGGLGGWTALADVVALPGVTAQVIVAVLLAPLGFLALLALFLPGSRLAALSLLTASLGFATAVGASRIAVATVGSQAVPVWTGTGLSLYWLGLIGALVVALRALGRWATLPAVASGVLLVIAAVPLAIALPLGQSSVRGGLQRALPAFVTAEAQSDPRAGTLEIVPQPDGGVRAVLQRGTGTTLDDQSTLNDTNESQSGDEVRLAELAGNLSSRSGLDASDGLDAFRIRFVLLAPPARELGHGVGTAAEETSRRTSTSLDGNPLLVPVGETAFGSLWRYERDGAAADAAVIPAHAGGWFGTLVLVVQAVVFGVTLLLSIPTGAGRDEPRAQTGRKGRPKPLADAAVEADVAEDPEPRESVEVDSAEDDPTAADGTEEDADASDPVAVPDSNRAQAPVPSPSADSPAETDGAQPERGDSGVLREPSDPAEGSAQTDDTEATAVGSATPMQGDDDAH
ncbi:glycosyltransferase [Luethyella okanaganae]|uniref:Glycosyltransferase n=1 Tax=Luethyella okanaganae TaxID=69372 RepID=A0ABW1VA31_9MICO